MDRVFSCKVIILKRKGFIYTPSNCTGCKACQVACKDKNELPADHFFRRVDAFEHQGEIQIYSGACNHCDRPGCVEGCPTAALYKAEDGTVQHHSGKCIGCGACIWNCPYGVPFLSPTKGISQKCDSCADLRREGQEPACVQACITHCLQFGDISDEVTPAFLPDKTITSPALVIVGNKRIADKQQIKSVGYRKDSGEHFLVLGGGSAALSAIEAIRERNHTCTITLISTESVLPYSRPMLTKTPLRGFNPDPFQIYNQAWYDKNNIKVYLHTTVEEIKPNEHRVNFQSGETLHYSKCIYALGAKSLIPPIDGVTQPGVFSIRTLTDIYSIRRWLTRHQQVVLIGGGVIGLETAFELKKYGCEVTVLESAPALMARLLDDKSSQQLKEQLMENNIPVYTGVQIEALYGEDKVAGVRLKDGRTFPANLVVITCGIQANTAIAEKAGAEIGRGIVVDENMRTTLPDIFACGDCAEWQGTNLAVWSEAMEQGRVAGANAAGELLAYRTVPAAVLMNGKVALYAEGDTGKSPGCEVREFLSAESARTAFLVNPIAPPLTVERYFFNNDIIVGGVLLGDLTRMRVLNRGIKDKKSQKAFLEEINATK